MAALKIPKENKKGLKKLAALDNDAVQELVSALREVSPVLYGVKLSAEVASK